MSGMRTHNGFDPSEIADLTFRQLKQLGKPTQTCDILPVIRCSS